MAYKISVVTVCYNVCDDLRKTILSVANQTYQNLEYIIIDGDSSDDTLDVINENKTHIDKWISEPDKGIYDAMNKGIDLATGDWIIFMNAGDCFYNNTVISDVFSKKYNDDVKLIYGDVALDFGSLGILPKKFAKIPAEKIPFEICHQSVFTDTNILKKIHYDLSFKICADCNSFAKISKMGFKLEYTPFFVSVFEVVNGVSSKRVIQSYKEHALVEEVKVSPLQHFLILSKLYLKCFLQKILPHLYYNKIRFKSIKNRIEYQ